MTSITLHAGDNRESLRRLIADGVRVHSVVTDPPYGLVSITKRFSKSSADDGTKTSERVRDRADGFGRIAAGGFMGSTWDGTGIERDPEFWKLIHDVLLPGGYVLAFSSPRTGHWQACAMEMAGFIMHPFFGWVYGSGFPKAHNASKAIDKHFGTTEARETVEELYTAKRIKPGATVVAEGGYGKQDAEFTATVSRRGSPEAQQWDGWAYGAQSMKPALEPIYVGQKPFSEKNGVLNLLKHGVGAMNIDGCRVPHVTVGDGNLALNPHLRETINGGNGGNIFPAETDRRVVTPNQGGRHPANLLHSGCDDVVAMFPQSKGQQGDVKGTEPSLPTDEIYGQFAERLPSVKRGDSGSAARFFNSFPLDADPLFYHAKATKADRAESRHPTVKPVALMRWLVRLVTPPGGTTLDPFAGSGTTGAAAQAEGFDCILMEAEEQFIADIRRRFGLEDDDPLAEFMDYESALG